MKGFVHIFLSMVLLLSLSSCAEKSNNLNPEAEQQDFMDGENYVNYMNNKTNGYADGVYEGEGNVWQYGKEVATVVIIDGRITCISLRKLDADGKEVNYDEWTGQEVNGNIRPNLKEYRMVLADRMIKAQTYDVPAIEGAGVSSESWKLAVKRALQKAER
ncbi:MAG: FMN-binding protein [Acetivibrionales bacterium]